MDALGDAREEARGSEWARLGEEMQAVGTRSRRKRLEERPVEKSGDGRRF
jgi:hypothetical protein